jgi:hypothetical protein
VENESILGFNFNTAGRLIRLANSSSTTNLNEADALNLTFGEGQDVGDLYQVRTRSEDYYDLLIRVIGQAADRGQAE